LGVHCGGEYLPADELDVEVTLTQRTAGGLAGESEGLEEHVVERAAVGHLLLQPRSLPGEGIIGERLHLRLERVDAGDLGPGALELPLVLGPDDLLEGPLDHDVPVPM